MDYRHHSGTSLLFQQAWLLLSFSSWSSWAIATDSGAGEAQTRQQVAILLQRASDMLDAGMNDEARTVYERILEFNPQNEAARSALLSMDQIDTTEVVPEEQAEPSPVDIEWARALALFDEGRWQEAIQRFTLVQSTQHDYKKEELDQRLFVAYVELARAVIADGSLEEAVQLFDKALELQPNDTLVRDERFMTAHYVDVKTYWSADWSRVISLLVDLYRVDPRLSGRTLPFAESARRAGRSIRSRRRVVRRRRLLYQRHRRARLVGSARQT